MADYMLVFLLEKILCLLGFLLQSLEDLDASLRKLNSRLFRDKRPTHRCVSQTEWEISRLSYEYDSEPFGKERDAAIKKLACEAGVEVTVRISHTLYDLDKIIELNGGQSPLTYKRFQTLISRMEPVEVPAESITAEVMWKCTTPLSDDHDDKFGVPSLEELGFDTEGLPSAVWPGGETEALTRLERHLERKAWVANFERPRMNANSLLASPTGLSPYLRFGCLSCRLFYFKLTDLYRKVKKNSSPPLSLYGQLLWREFFYTAATNNPCFDKMEGNPICMQIPWDRNAEALAKWAEGQTGFPWIDAIMTQLRQEGWIHHLARHAVACFLTRGDLWISWEEGMKVFEELLLDADWSVNAGSWMWLSCSSFFQQFFHCYCPVGFGRRTDPNGDYIRRYLPILRGFPAKYIYDPWNAPESVQKAAKCIVGVHYPKPMVNHAEASRLNIERMKQIYQQLSCYRGLGLLATVPSNANGNGEASSGMLGFSMETPHNAITPSGYQMAATPSQGDWQSAVMTYSQDETQSSLGAPQQQAPGYSAPGNSLMYYTQSAQQTLPPAVTQGARHHTQTSGKRHGEDLGSGTSSKFLRHRDPRSARRPSSGPRGAMEQTLDRQLLRQHVFSVSTCCNCSSSISISISSCCSDFQCSDDVSTRDEELVKPRCVKPRSRRDPPKPSRRAGLSGAWV
ncbi:Cryptochrome-1 [Merluccius polli]|uniref:Cryptochrome-1 n=1 Tax=Merluccius polli TaxID=89951 RepID=A0AA47MLG6_MERPO|nr:Cryptochrome-1 [Merluccius polli]